MHDIPIEQLKYPIGKFTVKRPISTKDNQSYINDIAALPAQLQATVQGFSEEQFDTPYRPCLLYTSPSPRDQRGSRMPSSA